MCVKLQYGLPPFQMILAMALLVWNAKWYVAMRLRHIDMPGTSPAYKLLISINAPLALPRAFWSRYLHLPVLWDNLALVVAIGFLWYWVALNVLSWRERRTVCIFSWMPLRLCGDVALICVGMFWLLDCWYEIIRFYQPVAWLDWARLTLLVGLPIAWSVVLILFFGRDLVYCVLRKKAVTGLHSLPGSS